MRDHILKVAEDLFYREGIRAVGVDRIIAEAGIAKATLYAKFHSKADLVTAYLKERSARVLALVHQRLAQASGSARDRALFLFDELERNSQPGSPFRGCAFMLAVAENPGDPAIQAIAVRHKDAFQALFFDIIKDDFDNPGSRSEQLAIIYEGALTLIALRGDNGCVAAAKICAGTVLGTS